MVEAYAELFFAVRPMRQATDWLLSRAVGYSAIRGFISPLPASAWKLAALTGGPLGQVLAGPVFGEETVLTADLDLDDIPRARFDFDSVGHYARPDVFRLVVNEAPRPAVEFDPRSPDWA